MFSPGITISVAGALTVTVTVVFVSLAPVIVIVVVPLPTGVIVPSGLTVATDSSSDLNVRSLLVASSG